MRTWSRVLEAGRVTVLEAGRVTMLVVLVVLLAGLAVTGCTGADDPAPVATAEDVGAPAPHTLDDVVRVLETASFEVDGGDALGSADVGTAALRVGDVAFEVTVHADEDAARADGGRRYGNLTFDGLDDGLQADADVISAIHTGLSE